MNGDVLNHFLLVVGIMASWLAAAFVMGGKQVFWDYNQFPEEEKSH